jgi:hypothetical protein
MPISESEVVWLESPAFLAQVLCVWLASHFRMAGRRSDQPPHFGARAAQPLGSAGTVARRAAAHAKAPFPYLPLRSVQRLPRQSPVGTEFSTKDWPIR